jgi:hypothetical protein
MQDVFLNQSNGGEIWVAIPETSCVLFPAEGSDPS